MSEAQVSRGRCRYYWVASAPSPPYRGGALLPRLCCSTARLPPIHRRPLDFTPPPHDGFALLASTRMRVPCYEHTIHGFAASHNTPWRMYSACRRCSPVLLCATLSHARLITKEP